MHSGAQKSAQTMRYGRESAKDRYLRWHKRWVASGVASVSCTVMRHW